MLEDRLEDAVLVFCREGRQGIGHRWPDTPPRQLLLDTVGEPDRELAAA